MSFTQADVDALDEAVKRGVAEVRYPNGQSVRFPSMDDLLKARTVAMREVAADLAAATGRTKPYSLAEFQG